jgi:uncharacterized protein (DUF1499 family)
MKILLYLVIGLLVIIGLYFVALSISSRKEPELGILNEQLRACPPTPNCVSSEQSGDVAFVEPLQVTTTMDEAWHRAKNAIVKTGGKIVDERDGYLHACFTTPVLRFIDDVELRLDENKRVIQIRSASRVGRSDMGTNRARVDKIRMAFGGASASGN